METPPWEYEYEKRLTGRNIRLLKLEDLEPGADADSLLYCSLEHHPLDGCTEFHALSYVWGQGPQTSRIVVDGRPCLVTDNLLEALLYIRLKWDAVTIWVDAICINQNDTEEKTEQVRMMRDIYSEASQVMIWLGEPYEDDDLGMQFAEELWAARKSWDEVATTWLDRLALDVINVPNHFFQKKRDDDWSALASLYSRPWFTRVWVIQELLMAKEAIFLYGLRNISADVLLYPAYAAKANVEVAEYLGLTEMAPNSPMRISSNVASLYFVAKGKGSRNFELLTLLDNARYSASTDPRDRVFALVGLTHDTPQDIISYDLTEREVIINLQISALQGGSFLDALARVDVSTLDTGRSGLPSWVPNWTRPDGHCRLMDEMIDPRMKVVTWARKNSHAWGESNSPITVRDELLTASGRVIDRIQSIIHPDLFFLTGKHPLLEISSQFHAWIGHLTRLTSPLTSYPIGCAIEEATWRALVGIMEEMADSDVAMGAFFPKWKQACTLVYLKEVLKNRHLLEEEPLLSDEEREILGRMVRDGTFWVESTDLFLTAGVQRFMKGLQLFAGGRKFCLTEKGYMGWIHADAKEGDEVVALKGTSLLFVARDRGGSLRARLEEGEAASGHVLEDDGVRRGLVRVKALVGAAWLYGLMNGEPGKMEEIPEEAVTFA
ncbi:hypothetical protein OQA88_9330 [Cercophora sp. LCS_1]